MDVVSNQPDVVPRGRKKWSLSGLATGEETIRERLMALPDTPSTADKQRPVDNDYKHWFAAFSPAKAIKKALHKHDGQKPDAGHPPRPPKMTVAAAVLDAQPSSPARDQMQSARFGNVKPIPRSLPAAPARPAAACAAQTQLPVVVAGIPLTGRSAALAAAALAASMSPCREVQPMAAPQQSAAPAPTSSKASSFMSEASTNVPLVTPSTAQSDAHASATPPPVRIPTAAQPPAAANHTAASTPQTSSTHLLQAAARELERMRTAHGVMASCNPDQAGAPLEAVSSGGKVCVPGLAELQRDAEAALHEAAAAASEALAHVTACSSLLEAMRHLGTAAASAQHAAEGREAISEFAAARLDAAGDAFARVEKLRSAWAPLVVSHMSTTSCVLKSSGTPRAAASAGAAATSNGPPETPIPCPVQGHDEEGQWGQQPDIAAAAPAPYQGKRWRRLVANPMFEGDAGDDARAAHIDSVYHMRRLSVLPSQPPYAPGVHHGSVRLQNMASAFHKLACATYFQWLEEEVVGHVVGATSGHDSSHSTQAAARGLLRHIHAGQASVAAYLARMAHPRDRMTNQTGGASPTAPPTHLPPCTPMPASGISPAVQGGAAASSSSENILDPAAASAAVAAVLGAGAEPGEVIRAAALGAQLRGARLAMRAYLGRTQDQP